jgi:glycosyltransferase involved in cell wall biosynthesis
MVDLFHALVSADPSMRARLLLVGDGWSRTDVEARIAATGVRDRVVMTGFRDDARELMAAMDVFVQPAHSEPFGLAAVEAMALERPVVVFRDGGGLTEIVRDGETGFVARDAAEAGGRLDALRRDPALAHRIGRQARTDVLARFDIATMERALRPCYEEALRSAANHRRNQRSSQSRSAFAK